MMYISVYPVVITMRHSNVYEERSLGIYMDETPPLRTQKLQTNFKAPPVVDRPVVARRRRSDARCRGTSRGMALAHTLDRTGVRLAMDQKPESVLSASRSRDSSHTTSGGWCWPCSLSALLRRAIGWQIP